VTTEARPTTQATIDYNEVDAAIGLDWWRADPNLQQLDERLAHDQDRPLADRHLANMGAVMRQRIARALSSRARTRPASRSTTLGNETNDVVHHQSDVAPVASQVGRAADECRDAIEYLNRAPQDIRLPKPAALSRSWPDVVQAALLVEEAACELEHKGCPQSSCGRLLRDQKLADRAAARHHVPRPHRARPLRRNRPLRTGSSVK
jgi:hypothetical protein